MIVGQLVNLPWILHILLLPQKRMFYAVNERMELFFLTIFEEEEEEDVR